VGKMKRYAPLLKKPIFEQGYELKCPVFWNNMNNKKGLISVRPFFIVYTLKNFQ